MFEGMDNSAGVKGRTPGPHLKEKGKNKKTLSLVPIPGSTATGQFGD
jgi:hypothetical protein